jgi:hypothetical protein
MRQAPWLVPIVIGVSLVWGVAQAAQLNFKADLNSASEVPPVTGAGKGSAMVCWTPLARR